MKDYGDTVLLGVPCGNLQTVRVVKIGRAEAQAIQLCINPPVLEKIGNEKLTPDQKWEIDKFKGDWLIDSYWLLDLRAYKGKENINIINDLPLTSHQRLDFKDRLYWAKVLNAQLNLCIGINEKNSLPKGYRTPYEWWEACIEERQKIQIKRILCNKDTKVKAINERGKDIINSLNKGTKLDEEEKVLRLLKKFQNPLKEHSQRMPHLYQLYEYFEQLSASSLKNNPTARLNSGEFRKNYSTPYNKAYSDYVRHIEKNPEIKAVIREEGKLYYQIRKDRIRIQVEGKKR